MSKPEPDELTAADAKKLKKAKKWLPNPQARPDWLTDGETTANLRGGLTFKQLGDFLGKPDGSGATASLEPARIRIVGPAFLPERPGEVSSPNQSVTSVR